MKLFNRLFKNRKQTIECPRCLGKGHVDSNDIKRLNKELKWRPGKCAYCNGSGKVDPEMPSKVPVDEAYLTTDLSPEERQKLLEKDCEAINRSRIHEMQVDIFIKQITYLHFIGNLDADKIAEFYLIQDTEIPNQDEVYLKEKQELMDYINSVIEHKMDNN